MNEEKESSSREMRILDWPWAVMASAVGLLMLGASYSLGDAYYVAYLQNFSIDEGGFPIDRSKHLLLALWGALNASFGFKKWIGQNWKPVLEVALVLLVYFAVTAGIYKIYEIKFLAANKAANRLGSFVSGHPLIGRYLKMLVVMVFVAYNMIAIALFAPLFLSIPSGIGEAAGTEVAHKRKEDFNKGCESSVRRCYSAIKGGKEVAHGFVVAQSPTRVALYYMGNTVQLPLDGVEMRMVRKVSVDVPYLDEHSGLEQDSGALVSPAK
ncbi:MULTISPECIES: hypothetical protein [Burkholderia]|uniref:hypothetical protein n=1 Tax=Burkholderia TaxID=32008 RepID=UPI000AAE44ED|nr:MULTISPECIES: hypothetical protein [Burkholderia]